jgi:hypothetical protein
VHVKDIEKHVRELAEAAGLELAKPPDPQKCWVDGKVRCPYGSPEGQFILRPEGACHRIEVIGDGCHVFHRHVFDPELEESQKAEAIREFFDANSGKLSDAVFEASKGFPDESAAAFTLMAASTLIVEKEKDCEILLSSDLPKKRGQEEVIKRRPLGRRYSF